MEFTEQDIQKEVKPLSENAFVRFFQRIARWWLGAWYGFADKHPKLAPWIYKIFFFFVFSMGVTIWQFIVMTFLPYAFAGMNKGNWGWPNVTIGDFTDNGATYMIFGDANGAGYFIAFELAVFTAQCINFPLQRNITYRSHGNPWYQAMWYFIGWVLVSVFTNAIWGLINVFLTHWGWYLAGNEGLATVAGLIKTVLTGGVSMIIFFFVFLVIFPDNNAVVKRAQAKLDKLTAAGADQAKIAAAKAKLEEAQKKADFSNAEKDAATARSKFNSSAMKYFSAKSNLEKEAEKAKEKGEPEKDEAAKAADAEMLAKKFEEACTALVEKREKEQAFADVKAAQAA